MAVRRLHPVQPESFEFTPENLAWAQQKLNDYPEGKQASAVIPLLWRAQEQHEGWLPEPAIRYVADMLDMAYIRVYEVATFYTMFQLGPVGKKAHIQVCGTTPCMLRGSEALVEVCKTRINPNPHGLSDDGDFSWEEVECLGVCANGPMVQIWKDTYEDLTPELFERVLDGFREGNPPKPGSQIGRQASAPLGGPTTLTDPDLYRDRSGGGSPDTPEGGVGAAGTGNSAGDVQGAAAIEPKNTSAASGSTQSAGDAPGTGAAEQSPKALDTTQAKVLETPRAPAAGAAGSTGAIGAANAKMAADSQSGADIADGASEDARAQLDDADRPEGLDAPRGGRADDLKRISGVGPKLENTLNDLGIYHFDQIAAWSPETVSWVDRYLSFKGRIDRERWIEQAKTLASDQNGSDKA